MAELPSHASVVVIGGGAVGASTLYHLAKMGVTDALLLEKNELTAGSSWHAAGNCPNFSASWSIMKMQSYSTRLYKTLGDDVDYPINYSVTGAIRLAHNANRMREFERVVAMANAQGHDKITMMSNAEMQEVFPFLETHDLLGGCYDPDDGDIDPAQLTQAFARGARNLGAKIERFCPVTGISRENGEWVIETEKGTVRCEKVVNAAGYYAPKVWDMFRPYSAYAQRDLPSAVLAHQYLVTEEIEELKGREKLPMLRDPDSSYYLRQENHGLLLGPYERECKAHWHTDDDKMPDDFSFQLYPDDLERIEGHIEDACARVPLLGTAGIMRVINGPIPYTPDGNPLIGPMPGVPNAFEACVFTFGIVQSGGAGKVAAEWVVEGETEWDMWSVDPRRFTGFVDEKYALVKGIEIYANEYAMHYPHYEWPEGRDKRLSPVQDKIKDLGAVFGARGGWERAMFYADPATAANTDSWLEKAETWGRDFGGEEYVKAECQAVAKDVGLCDMPGFSRYMLTGAGCADWLSTVTTGVVPKIGRLGLLYFADQKGRVVSEMTAMRIEEDKLMIITAAPAQWHDLEWLCSHLPTEGDIALKDVTDDFSCLVLSGPKSRDLISKLCDADLTKSWLSHQTTQVAGKYLQLVRVSYVGELGWELHVMTDDMPAVFDAVWAEGQNHGLKPFGMYAMDSMRLEKGYRAWKSDLTTDYDMISAGLGRFIKWDKPEFVGKQALEAIRGSNDHQSFVSLTVDAGDADATYLANIYAGDKHVGFVTSGGYGYRVDKSIALAVVDSEHATAGTKLTIDIFGERRDATVEAEPHYDAPHDRVRA